MCRRLRLNSVQACLLILFIKGYLKSLVSCQGAANEVGLEKWGRRGVERKCFLFRPLNMQCFHTAEIEMVFKELKANYSRCKHSPLSLSLLWAIDEIAKIVRRDLGAKIKGKSFKCRGPTSILRVLHKWPNFQKCWASCSSSWWSQQRLQGAQHFWKSGYLPGCSYESAADWL